MYGSSYYKLEARRMLSGGYGAAVIGAAILMIPAYLLSLIEQLIFGSANAAGFTIGSTVIEFIFSVFVTNILSVGYYRFLLSYEKTEPVNDGERIKHDHNLVVSGYTHNFANTLKVMFTRDIYMIGWLLVGLVPMLLYIGFIAFMSYSTDIISNVYDLFTQAMTSPTYDMAQNLANYIAVNCPYLPMLTMLMFFLTIAALIPFIMKNYEYSAIPMILADNPNMDKLHAFARTKDIMTGFKLRYFLIQLSFLGYSLLITIGYLLTGSQIVFIIGMLLLNPYISMTLLRFYRERNNTIEYNISFYGAHMP